MMASTDTSWSVLYNREAHLLTGDDGRGLHDHVNDHFDVRVIKTDRSYDVLKEITDSSINFVA